MLLRFLFFNTLQIFRVQKLLATVQKPVVLRKIYGELRVSALHLPVEWHSHLFNNDLIYRCCVKLVTLQRWAEGNGFGGYINGADLYWSQSFMVHCARLYFHFSFLFEINVWEYFLSCFRDVFRGFLFLEYLLSVMRDIVLGSFAGRSLAPPQVNTGATVEAITTHQTINIAQLFQNRILLLFFFPI